MANEGTLREIVEIIRETIGKYYKKANKLTVRARYKGMSAGFARILDIAEVRFRDDARAYYAQRSKVDEKLEQIQTRAKAEIEACLRASYEKIIIERVVIPLSSFSARTNLVGESDLDFGVLVSEPDLPESEVFSERKDRLGQAKGICDKVISFSNALGICGYKMSDIRNRHDAAVIHWVFCKKMEGVEIEVKVRDADGFREFAKMHKYTDTEMPIRDKVLATYCKFLMSKFDKQAYADFKMLYYCNAGHHGGSGKLLYALQ